jgi:hypothetical protein
LDAVLAAGARLDLLKPHASAGYDGSLGGLRDPSNEGSAEQALAGPPSIHRVCRVELRVREFVDLPPHLAPLVYEGVEVPQCGAPDSDPFAVRWHAPVYADAAKNLRYAFTRRPLMSRRQRPKS